MKVRCLCPTYGYPPHLIENIIKCFNSQDYPVEDRKLFILDDLGNIRPTSNVEENWYIVGALDRAKSLPAKYNFMWQKIAPPLPGEYEEKDELIVVMEVDDLYLPGHISSYVEAVEGKDFVYPEEVFTTYGKKLKVEKTGKRFHASIAIRTSFLREIGGWIDTPKRDFDQQFIGKMLEVGKRAVPQDFPTYCFRWEDTLATHGQFYMPNHEDDWWDRVKPQHTDPIDHIEPKYDQYASSVLDLICERCDQARQTGLSLLELNPQ